MTVLLKTHFLAACGDPAALAGGVGSPACCRQSCRHLFAAEATGRLDSRPQAGGSPHPASNTGQRPKHWVAAGRAVLPGKREGDAAQFAVDAERAAVDDGQAQPDASGVRGCRPARLRIEGRRQDDGRSTISLSSESLAFDPIARLGGRSANLRFHRFAQSRVANHREAKNRSLRELGELVENIRQAA